MTGGCHFAFCTPPANPAACASSASRAGAAPQDRVSSSSSSPLLTQRGLRVSDAENAITRSTSIIPARIRSSTGARRDRGSDRLGQSLRVMHELRGQPEPPLEMLIGKLSWSISCWSRATSARRIPRSRSIVPRTASRCCIPATPASSAVASDVPLSDAGRPTFQLDDCEAAGRLRAGASRRAGHNRLAKGLSHGAAEQRLLRDRRPGR